VCRASDRRCDLRFDPSVPGRFFERDECAHEWNENRRANLESALPRRQQMAEFVHEDEQHKPHGKPHAPNGRIDPDGDEHRATGLEYRRKEFKDGQDKEFELGAEFEEQQQDDADWREEFFETVPSRGFRRSSVTRWRRWRWWWWWWRQSIHGIFRDKSL